MSAIQYDVELKFYYERILGEGKKMIVLNAVRNKLVLGIYTVVKDGMKYEEKTSEMRVKNTKFYYFFNCRNLT